MKYIITIGDGMADNPVPALGGRTPLEVARIPLIDALAKNGELGSVLTVPPEVAPGSDTAILSIFGYDPRKYYSGRSPLEAAGSGVALQSGDVSYRCNMVSLGDGGMPYEEKKIRSHSGGAVEGEASVALLRALLADGEFSALAKKHGILFYESPSFRHIAVQRGADITGLDAQPPHEHLEEPLGPLLPRGCEAAEGLRALMARAHAVLDGHPINRRRREAGKLPANGIWFWAEGKAMALPSFYEKHRKKGMVVSAVPLVRGIGALGGLHSVEVEGATGELATNYEGKAAAVLKALCGGYDLAVLHVEAPDECTHNGDTAGKLQAIEWLDSRAVGPLKAGLDGMGEPWRMLILSDHKTLTATRGHGGGPVPYLIYDSRRRAGGSGLAYTEANALAGPFTEEGHTLLGRFLRE
jgi:2,3-bisphosphoglycerate-independent phosphoglycerate mutase